jgi:hypothetical protein
LPYHLHKDPQLAVAELYRAWTNTDADAYALLIDHAFRVVRAIDRGDPVRLHLLELVANILRDADSLLTLPVATRWLHEATVGPRVPNRPMIAAIRTRAHVLQVHGHLDLAAAEFERALAMLPSVRFDRPDDGWSEQVDLLLRRASVELCYAQRANTKRIDRWLHHVETLPAPANPLQVLRIELQLAALSLKADGRRHSPQAMRRYDANHDRLLGALSPGPGHFSLGALNTLVRVDLQVGESPTVVARLIEDWIPQLERVSAWANQFHRLTITMERASRRGRRPIDLDVVPRVPFALRVDGTLPTSPQFLV